MPRPIDPDRADRNRRYAVQCQRVAEIIGRLADRLPAVVLERSQEDMRFGYEGYALDRVLARLVRDAIPVTRAEKQALGEAAAYYPQPDRDMRSTTPETLAALTIADQSGASDGQSR